MANINHNPVVNVRRQSIQWVSNGKSLSDTKHLFKNKESLRNDVVKLHVYRKTLQCFIYPISSTTPHNFYIWSANQPTYCYECGSLLWGLARQGLKCSACGIKCHEKCKDLLNADCLQRVVAKNSKNGTDHAAQVLVQSMEDSMKQRTQEKADAFEFIRKVFEVRPEVHMIEMERSQQFIIDGTSKWSAKLHLTVKSAQGLVAKDKWGTSDPYVIVQVGKTKKRTKTISRELNPVWDEDFSFYCHNVNDRIKVRIWDEDFDAKSVIKSKLLRESDDFLGQTIIDVRTLSGVADVWYNLRQRTDKSVVSGSIHLVLALEFDGEDNKHSACYHQQYTCLHINIFNYFEDVYLEFLKGNLDRSKIYFPQLAQNIVDEFSLRYGIEEIYVRMTHFSCLASKVACSGVAAVLSELLANINKYFSLSTGKANSVSTLEHFHASNFKCEAFIEIIDQLHDSVKIQLTSYRSNYPSNDQSRLADMKSAIDLLTSVSFFRQKILELPFPPNAVNIVRDSITTCSHSTYTYLYDNSWNLDGAPDRENRGAELDADQESHPGVKSIEFWDRLLLLIVETIEEDTVYYTPVVNQFPKQLVLGDISTAILWQRFSVGVSAALREYEIQGGYKITDYVNFLFRVKTCFDKYVAHRAQHIGLVPEYPGWFNCFVVQWISEVERSNMITITKAFEKDTVDGFKAISTDVLYSCSIVDVFASLGASHNVIRNLDCPDPELRKDYYLRFCKLLERCLRQLSNLIAAEFKQHYSCPNTLCVLLSDLHQMRLELANIFEQMGGKKLPDNCIHLLELTQFFLLEDLDRLTLEFVSILDSEIVDSVIYVGDILHSLKLSTNPASREDEIKRELSELASETLAPLGNFLYETFALLTERLNQKVSRRILKHLWRRTTALLECKVVIPPVCGKAASSKHLSDKQCSVLEHVVDMMMHLFMDESSFKRLPFAGLRESYMAKTLEYQNLVYTLSLYNENTAKILRTFVYTQNSQTNVDSEPFGKLFVQIDASRHLGTDEHILKVKDLLANNLQWEDGTSKMFKPYVDIHLIGPHLERQKRHYSTKSRSNTWSPQFEESFQFTITGEENDLSYYELHFVVRDYCFIKVSRIIGVSLLPLKQLYSEGDDASRGNRKPRSVCFWLPLIGSFNFNDSGRTILRIMSQRSGDCIAKEFVTLKMMQRTER